MSHDVTDPIVFFFFQWCISSAASKVMFQWQFTIDAQPIRLEFILIKWPHIPFRYTDQSGPLAVHIDITGRKELLWQTNLFSQSAQHMWRRNMVCCSELRKIINSSFPQRISAIAYPCSCLIVFIEYISALTVHVAMFNLLMITYRQTGYNYISWIVEQVYQSKQNRVRCIVSLLWCAC